MTTQRARVGEVLKLQRRQVIVEPRAEYEEIGIRSFGRGIFHKEPVSGLELGGKRVFRIEPGDLVLSNVFAWEGAIATASEAERGRIGSHRFMTFTPADDRIDISWARWFFLSEPGLELIRKASPGSAGRNRTLAMDRFEALEFSLPSIGEQRRVARRLDHSLRLSNGFRVLAARSSAFLDAMGIATLVRAHGRAARAPISALVSPVSRTIAIAPEQEYRLVGCRWYGEGLFQRERKMGRDIGASKLFALKRGDLVYNRLFAWKGSFGLVESHLEGAFVSGEFPTFEVDKTQVLPEFLLATTATPEFLAEVNDRSTGSTPTSRNRLKEEQFQSIEISLPSIDVQAEIVARLHQLRNVAALRRSQSAIVEALVPATLNEEFSTLS